MRPTSSLVRILSTLPADCKGFVEFAVRQWIAAGKGRDSGGRGMEG